MNRANKVKIAAFLQAMLFVTTCVLHLSAGAIVFAGFCTVACIWMMLDVMEQENDN